MSRLCDDIDEPVQVFLARLIEGGWPDLWIDAALSDDPFINLLLAAA